MKKALLALALTAAFGVANAAQNVNTDVVIVGAGGAGLAAAVEAHDLGAKDGFPGRQHHPRCRRPERCCHASAAG
jgi:shikimate 5-dehydrogenase